LENVGDSEIRVLAFEVKLKVAERVVAEARARARH
jgi:hypothetical protein